MGKKLHMPVEFSQSFNRCWDLEKWFKKFKNWEIVLFLRNVCISLSQHWNWTNALLFFGNWENCRGKDLVLVELPYDWLNTDEKLNAWVPDSKTTCVDVRLISSQRHKLRLNIEPSMTWVVFLSDTWCCIIFKCTHWVDAPGFFFSNIPKNCFILTNLVISITDSLGPQPRESNTADEIVVYVKLETRLWDSRLDFETRNLILRLKTLFWDSRIDC